MEHRDDIYRKAKAYVRERYPFDEDTQQFRDMVDRVYGELYYESLNADDSSD